MSLLQTSYTPSRTVTQQTPQESKTSPFLQILPSGNSHDDLCRRVTTANLSLEIPAQKVDPSCGEVSTNPQLIRGAYHSHTLSTNDVVEEGPPFPSGSLDLWDMPGRRSRSDHLARKTLSFKSPLNSRLTAFHTCCYSSWLEESSASCVTPPGALTPGFLQTSPHKPFPIWVPALQSLAGVLHSLRPMS